MPKDNSIKSVLIVGSGPIIIGQACEFDYSGSQAARSLREEGIKVILINSNPATIMTDPMMADKVYLLPLTIESIEKILQENQIDAVLPTMGGQTALNLCKEADELGIWEQYNCRMIGVDVAAINTAEDREKFRQLMVKIGMAVAPSQVANSFLEGKEIAQRIGFPLVIRPSFTLGGTGGGPYWGWWYSPFTSYLYPIFDIVPLDYNLVEIKSKNTEVQKESGNYNERNKKEKFIDIKLIYPSYK
jgi:carbamoyl-phosphate synthase large subunit